jgi:hypothetical protein
MELGKKIFGGIAFWTIWIFSGLFWILLVMDLDANKIHLSTATKGIGNGLSAWVGYYLARWWRRLIITDKITWW